MLLYTNETNVVLINENLAFKLNLNPALLNSKINKPSNLTRNLSV